MHFTLQKSVLFSPLFFCSLDQLEQDWSLEFTHETVELSVFFISLNFGEERRMVKSIFNCQLNLCKGYYAILIFSLFFFSIVLLQKIIHFIQLFVYKHRHTRPWNCILNQLMTGWSISSAVQNVSVEHSGPSVAERLSSRCTRE